MEPLVANSPLYARIRRHNNNDDVNTENNEPCGPDQPKHHVRRVGYSRCTTCWQESLNVPCCLTKSKEMEKRLSHRFNFKNHD